ncbi:hypothetical protein AAF712_002858 [Marasmius tenuissimus]|uniref:NmrA-like domain-containing protein n=1 Tax=Marasmius tenuissimus TaxID=585030 RepID=A0ABR3A7K5_9AGAR
MSSSGSSSPTSINTITPTLSTPTTAATSVGTSTKSDVKRILVAGATGKQGFATVRALLRLNGIQDTQQDRFQILALTRNERSKAAQELASFNSSSLGKNVGEDDFEVVEADLNSKESVRAIFERYRDDGGIYGVFSVQAFPGLGVDSSGEEAQGKNIADVAYEFRVQHFVYSSSERAEEVFDDQAKEGSSHLAKVRIEERVKELGEMEGGFGWTILRPVRFYENFSGPLGGVTFAIFRAGMKETTRLDLVAADDVGRIAAEVFRNPTPYSHKILVPVGDTLTCRQIEEVHLKASGKSITKVPGIVANGLLWMNKGTKDMLASIERPAEALAQGLLPNLPDQIEDARKAFVGGEDDKEGQKRGLTTFEEWVHLHEYEQEGTQAKTKSEVEQDTSGSGWNRVSLVKLISGRH